MARLAGGAAMTVHAPYAPDALSTLTTVELQAIFRDAATLPLESLLNGGQVTIDAQNHRIWRDSFWKGSFAKDTLLGWEERLATPIRAGRPVFAGGRFWKRFDRIAGDEALGHIVNYGLEFLPGLPRVRQVAYPDGKRSYLRQGDDVLLLRYSNSPYRPVYDLIKVVDQNNCVGVMHIGRFPKGFQFATFVMSRHNYPFEKMFVPDHEALLAGGHLRSPSRSELAGAWRGYVVFLHRADHTLHNQFNPRAIRCDFTSDGGARLRTGLRRSAPRVEFEPDCVRLTGSAATDEIRMLDADTLIGLRRRRDRDAPSLRYVMTRITS
jgi:hypothetical protein